MKYNGIDVCTVDPAISVEKEFPPGAPARENEIIAGSEGGVATGYTIETGEYRARVNIACRRATDGMRVRAKLAAWAWGSGTGMGKLEPGKWPGVYYDAVLRSISAPRFNRGFATVEIIFDLPRPIAKNLFAQTANGAGGLQLMFGGSAEARPTITQTMATAHAGGIAWTMDGAPLVTLTGSIAAGAEVAVDFAAGTVTINGQPAETQINFQATNWRPGFTPGPLHTIASNDGGQMTARWRAEWV